MKQEIDNEQFCSSFNRLLSTHNLYATGTTGRIIEDINAVWKTDTTADMIITSPLYADDTYERIVPDVINRYKNRTI